MNKKEMNLLKGFLEEVKWHPEFENIEFLEISKTSILGNNLLHVAAIKNLPKIIKILVELGLNINQQGEHGYTPLHEAAEQGNAEVFEALLSLGADINIKNIDGLSAVELKGIMGASGDVVDRGSAD